MGLDISYYSGLALAPEADPEDWQSVFQPTIPPDFADRADGLEDRATYTFAKSAGFRAGSYSGYNDWREELAKLAGYPAYGLDERHQHSQGAWEWDSGPFWELIHFTDCDGVIGPKVAAKLAADFAEYQDRAPNGWFGDLYAKWRTAFETAADNGAVHFH